jgi:diguanylate cyclase (GGDEF)-like protein
MITRIAKSIRVAIKVAVISFDRAFRNNHGIDEILGFTDELTKLPNLKAFTRDSKSISEEYALVLIDVDDFKMANDFYGHAFGNSILKRIAYALDYAVSFCGIAYRLHGDEFALIIKKEEVERVCSEIQSHFRKEDNISISQGVVVFDNKTVAFDKLFKTADKALYQSKRNGKGITTMIPVCA